MLTGRYRALAVGLVIALWTSTPIPAASAGGIDFAEAREDRASFGLAADDRTLQALVGKSADVGTSKWGIPLTAEEEEALDLPGRMQFATDVRSDVLPMAQSAPVYAGAYFDQKSGGRLIIQLAEKDLALERRILDAMPTPGLGVEFVVVDTTEADLRSAARALPDIWRQHALPAMLDLAVDVEHTQIVVHVLPDQLNPSQSGIDEVARALGVPLSVRQGSDGLDTACTSRDNCYNPMMAGLRIYKGVIDSYNECTMGFHFVYASGPPDIQFMTAGHCGYSGSNNWYNPGVPGDHKIGVELGTLYVAEGQDAMRVSMLDAQASDLVFIGINVTGYRVPIQGEPVCASRGKSNVLDCGTVSSTSARWYSETAGYYVWGGDTTGIASVKGDSGSPIWQNDTTPSAIGLLTHENGYMAIVADVLPYFGSGWIYEP